MTGDFEDIKSKVRIEDIIRKTYKDLETGNKRYLRRSSDHSFVVDTENQYFFQNDGGGEGKGDVFVWVQYAERCDVKEAVEWVCAYAKLPAPVWGGDPKAHLQQRANEDALTVVSSTFTRWLNGSEAALEYVHKRGWNDDTVKKASLGYSGSGKAVEREQLIEALKANGHDLDSPIVAAVLGHRGNLAEWCKKWNVKPTMKQLERDAVGGIPPNMLIYPHVRGGRARYITARIVSYEDKRALEDKGIVPHYNLPENLAGKKQFYFNFVYSPKAELVGIVEGQADAVTLGQWGIAGVGVCNNAADDEFAAEMRKHRYPVVALDFEMKMWGQAKKLAGQIGPRTRLFKGLPA